MAYISFQPHDHFDCPIWNGSDSTTTITGMDFKPDMLWIRRYDGLGDAVFNDSTKGIGFNWKPAGNNANDNTNYVATYTSDGFTLTGNINNSNDANQKYTSACWKAAGGTTSSNSDGSITSSVQANTTSGISVVSYNGTGSAATVGHGLGVAPKVIICKNLALADRGVTLNMSNLYATDPETDNIQFALESGTLTDQADKWNDTAPTTSVFSVGSSNMVNNSGNVHIAYCFAEKNGFSKMGYYKGNGNVEGSYIYCGFRPKWIMVKKSDTSEEWFVKQSGLDGYGVGSEKTRTIKYSTTSLSTNCTFQFLATGFRPITTDGKGNGNGNIYWYMAFAEMPIVGSNGTISLAT